MQRLVPVAPAHVIGDHSNSHHRTRPRLQAANNAANAVAKKTATSLRVPQFLSATLPPLTTRSSASTCTRSASRCAFAPQCQHPPRAQAMVAGLSLRQQLCCNNSTLSYQRPRESLSTFVHTNRLDLPFALPHIFSYAPRQSTRAGAIDVRRYRAVHRVHLLL